MTRMLLGIAAVFLFVTAACADMVELRLASTTMLGSLQQRVQERAAQEMREQSGGRVSLRYLEASTQGDERDLVRRIKTGQLDGAVLSSTGLALIDESIRVLSLPLLFKSAEEADYVAEKFWPHLQRTFEKKGFKLGARGEIGWNHLLSRNRIETYADLSGQKLAQISDDALLGMLFRKLRLSVVPLGYSEIDPSLTSGRINACYGVPLEAVAMHWYSKVRFMSALPLSYDVNATVIAMNAFGRLTTNDQRLFSYIDHASQTKQRTLSRRGNDDAREFMARRGITLLPVSPALAAEITNKAQELHNELEGKFSPLKDELGMVLRFRSEYRARSGGK